jgi:hypothetical protein
MRQTKQQRPVQRSDLTSFEYAAWRKVLQRQLRVMLSISTSTGKYLKFPQFLHQMPRERRNSSSSNGISLFCFSLECNFATTNPLKRRDVKLPCFGLRVNYMYCIKKGWTAIQHMRTTAYYSSQTDDLPKCCHEQDFGSHTHSRRDRILSENGNANLSWA